jgi:hypothetical protein
MSAEILTIPPISGKFQERHFGEHFHAPVWVQFTDNNSEDWVGCFSRPFEGGLCQALTNESNTRAFVIAGGEGYLIDIDTKELITNLEDQPFIESAIHTTNPDYFIAGATYCIYVLNDSGLLKQIKPDSIIDGIYFKNQVEKKAIGELATADNHYERNVDFEFDLTTFELTLTDKGNKWFLNNIWDKLTK